MALRWRVSSLPPSLPQRRGDTWGFPRTSARRWHTLPASSSVVARWGLPGGRLCCILTPSTSPSPLRVSQAEAPFSQPVSKHTYLPPSLLPSLPFPPPFPSSATEGPWVWVGPRHVCHPLAICIDSCFFACFVWSLCACACVCVCVCLCAFSCQVVISEDLR